MRGAALYIDPFIYGGGGAANGKDHADRALRMGAKWIQMSVMWKDLQPGDNQFNFQALSDYIAAIKARGLGVSMRTYGGATWDTPDYIMWAQPSRGAEIRTEFKEFCQALASFLSARGSLPNEWQVSASGEYAEMAINDVPTPAWTVIRDFMVAQMQGARAGGFSGGFSACFNPQWSDSEIIQLVTSLKDNGLVKLQQNCAFWCVENCTYWGPQTIGWLLEFKRTMGIAIVVEDQEGGVPSHYSNGCGQWPGFESLQSRYDRWQRIAAARGVDPKTLDGVTWDPQDDRSDNYGNNLWVALFGG